MNTPRLRLFVCFAVAPFLAALARADEASYASLLKERDAVLTQILAYRERAVATGIVKEQDVISARVALWSFRRDTATSTAEKIKQQELIVGVWQKKLDGQKSRLKSGMASDEDILIATDSLLQARQVLEELKLEAKQG